MSSVLEELIKLDTEDFSAPAKKKKKESPLVILRRDFFVLLSNCTHSQKQLPYCAAKLIDYYLHWHKWKMSTHRTPWFYQPVKNIYEDLMQEHSRHLIREAIALLMQLGYLERRNNPGNGQDRTYQYRLCIKRIIKALKNFTGADISATTIDMMKKVVDTTDPLDDPVSTSNASEPTNFSSSENHTGSSFVISEQGEFTSESAQFNVEQYQQHQSIDIRSTSIDEKFDEEKDSVEELEQGNCEALTYRVEIPTDIDGLVTSFPNPGESQFSAAESPNLEITDYVEQQELTDALQGLFAAKENNRSVPPERQPEPRRIRIDGLDEETHEILWQHQAELTRLNVDLDANRIQNAIAYNPQYLENAIFAFFEASAKRTLTKEAATGYLYNALRNGWKPKYSQVPTTQKPRYFTAPPQFFEKRQVPTLAELVERKRQAWKVAILRPFIEAWAKVTPGVVLTASGPALETGYQG